MKKVYSVAPKLKLYQWFFIKLKRNVLKNTVYAYSFMLSYYLLISSLSFIVPRFFSFCFSDYWSDSFVLCRYVVSAKVR